MLWNGLSKKKGRNLISNDRWVDFTYIVEQFTGYVDFFLNRVNMLRLGWNLDEMLLGKIEQVMLKIGLDMLHVGNILHVTLKIGCYVLG